MTIQTEIPQKMKLLNQDKTCCYAYDFGKVFGLTCVARLRPCDHISGCPYEQRMVKYKEQK